MYFKKVVGERCYLSPINPEDFEHYTHWVNDMEVGIGMVFSSSIVTVDQEREILKRLSSSQKNFAIIDIVTNKVIGNVGFVNLDHMNQTGEVGIFIGNRAYLGKGYGTEAMKLILDFGFNILNLHNISLKVYEYNMPAYKSYKKVGFKEAGRIRKAKMIGGVRYDEVYMDILAEEFESPYIKGLVESKLNCGK